MRPAWRITSASSMPRNAEYKTPNRGSVVCPCDCGVPIRYMKDRETGRWLPIEEDSISDADFEYFPVTQKIHTDKRCRDARSTPDEISAYSEGYQQGRMYPLAPNEREAFVEGFKAGSAERLDQVTREELDLEDLERETQ